MQARTRLLDSALLGIALAGPIFHLLGIIARGPALLNSDLPRLGFTYLALALGAAAGASLALHHGRFAVRLAAGLALLANLGSIAYAGKLWSRDMERSLAEATMVPIEAGKVGILVSPASHSPQAKSEARAVEDVINGIIRQTQLDPFIVVRRVYPVSSEEQAQRVGRRMRANIVVWKRELDDDSAAVDRHVTVLGANETAIEFEALSLMLLMATQGTFTVRTPNSAGEDGAALIITRVIGPVAAAFGSLAVDRPVLAASQFQGALEVAGIPTTTLRSLHDYRGTALLFAHRPDLAILEFEVAQGIRPDGRGWVGVGNVFMARREWRAAADAFQKALTLNPYDAMLYCGLGIVSAVQHDVAQAISYYEQAIALEPGWGAPYALLGLAHELAADSDAAREAYQTCALFSGPNIGLYIAALDRAESVSRHPPTAVPTATPVPIPSPTPVPTVAVYRVERGDTLKAIADDFGVSVELLVEVNDLDDPNAIRAGQRLIIPRLP